MLVLLVPSVNPTFTRRINELSIDESRSVLDYLFRVQVRRVVLSCHDLSRQRDSVLISRDVPPLTPFYSTRVTRRTSSTAGLSRTLRSGVTPS